MLNDHQKIINSMNKENLIEAKKLTFFDMMKLNKESQLPPQLLNMPKRNSSPNVQKDFEETVDKFMDSYCQQEMTEMDTNLLNGVL